MMTEVRNRDMIAAEKTMTLIGKEEETTAQGTGKKDKMIEEEIEEIILLKKAGGTLVIIGEGDAKGPLVMEGPLQANP